MDQERNISLLYVEDDLEARDLLEKLLNRKFPTLAVLIAADGEEGWALYDRHRPQLILTGRPTLQMLLHPYPTRCFHRNAKPYHYEACASLNYASALYQSTSSDRFSGCVEAVM